MILRLPILLTAALLSAHPVFTLSPSDIPSDTPTESLISSANAQLAGGNFNDALTYFDAAISRDPKNYLTIFKRGATYLSLGKQAQASYDFDAVLAIKPDFEGALMQRAKLKAKSADWDAARRDYEAAGRQKGPEIGELEEAQGASILATDAANRGDWEQCVSNAGVAIMVAGTSLSLRQLRARCRFEKGEVYEGISDLGHVLQIAPGSITPHLQMSAMMFYSLGDTERGMAQIRKCLHSDPDSKPCSRLFRQEKTLSKTLGKLTQLMEKRQFAAAAKLLVPSGDDRGLIQEIRDTVKALVDEGTIHPKASSELLSRALEMTCEAYTEMGNAKKGSPYCTEVLSYNPNSLAGLLSKATKQLDADEFEAAINTLNHAKEHHPSASQINNLLQKAQVLLRRSKQKDYYKTLGVSRDADDRTIKRAYRQLTKQFHPDKAHQNGISKEDAEKKMATINEAYEVLIDPELRARFDNGDDPNSQEGPGGPFQGSPFGQGQGGQQFFFRGGPGGFPGGFPGGGQFKFQQGPGGGFKFPGF
ncbi:DnaJ domain-containing protein [Xylona heveae TC161]|uniref:Tetratricopeptide repeat and J domain-containing co-chaperone DNJ1 n=1 Tax=Xylona heveae (strain CBS 132557 / TC161) TaxID=1328760 RepID=A0A165GA55_XYLHT|nr:DnaJ domain-containing protein [Xylona heveae TC161]KZF21938.1 DnaJ domain-containing protein [Xylona heveae TC161]